LPVAPADGATAVGEHIGHDFALGEQIRHEGLAPYRSKEYYACWCYLPVTHPNGSLVGEHNRRDAMAPHRSKEK